MWHQLLGDSGLYELLLRVDEDLVQETKAGRCTRCRGPLHVGDYPRKPRGEELPPKLAAQYERRLSLCCGREGCRRRATPPSVRFFGRRLYLAAIVTLVTALRHGPTESRRRALGAHVSSLISRQTLGRWVTWWREVFPATRCWASLRGYLSPPPVASELPLSLLARVGAGETARTRLALALYHLGAVTTATCPGSAAVPRDLRGTQKL